MGKGLPRAARWQSSRLLFCSKRDRMLVRACPNHFRFGVADQRADHIAPGGEQPRRPQPRERVPVPPVQHESHYPGSVRPMSTR